MLLVFTAYFIPIVYSTDYFITSFPLIFFLLYPIESCGNTKLTPGISNSDSAICVIATTCFVCANKKTHNGREMLIIELLGKPLV